MLNSNNQFDCQKNAHTIIRDQNFGNPLAENGDNFTSLMKSYQKFSKKYGITHSQS